MRHQCKTVLYSRLGHAGSSVQPQTQIISKNDTAQYEHEPRFTYDGSSNIAFYSRHKLKISMWKKTCLSVNNVDCLVDWAHFC